MVKENSIGNAVINKEDRKSFQERFKELSEEQRRLIDFAYDLAKESHRPQERDGGERYFEHVRDVALILVDECKIIDTDLIISALLHDSVEDSATFGNRKLPYSKWRETANFRLTKVFNQDVATLVISLTKPLADGEKIKTKEDAEIMYFENFRNGKEKTILLKMCDRLHNLRSLASTTPEKQVRKIKETEEEYYPIFESTMDLPLFQKERTMLLEKIKAEVEKLKLKIETKEKPAILYHASNKDDLDELDPKYNYKTRSANENSATFAAPNYAVATIFLVPTDNTWANSGSINDNWYFVCSDKDRFSNMDTGGVIYSLPSDSFNFDPNKGLGEAEWTSTEKVKPIDKKIIPKALDEMIRNGVRVYFVNKDLYDRFESSHHNGEDIEILNSLKSENEIRGVILPPIT